MASPQLPKKNTSEQNWNPKIIKSDLIELQES